MIVDCCDENYMSVSNNAEGVLTEIKEKIGNYVKEYDVIYRDTEGIWDTMSPTWSNECENVKFKSGVGDFKITLSVM
jgi:hypothetical protein